LDADYFRLLYDFGWWARDRLFAAAEGMSDDEWRRPNGFTYGSLAGILRHTLSAESVWSERFRTRELFRPGPAPDVEPGIDELRNAWQQEEARMRPWLLQLQDADLHSTIPTRDGQVEIWGSLAHVTYHGMQHRSEAAEALTMIGRSPGNLDLGIYLSERG